MLILLVNNATLKKTIMCLMRKLLITSIDVSMTTKRQRVKYNKYDPISYTHTHTHTHIHTITFITPKAEFGWAVQSVAPLKLLKKWFYSYLTIRVPHMLLICTIRLMLYALWHISDLFIWVQVVQFTAPIQLVYVFQTWINLKVFWVVCRTFDSDFN